MTQNNDTLGGKAANATDGHDDPNRGPLDRAANAITGGTGGVSGAMSGGTQPGTGSMAGATDGYDDPNRGPLDRAANAISGHSGGVSAAVGGTAGATMGGASTMGQPAMSGTTSSMAAGGRRVVSAVFDTQAEAQRAVGELRQAGVSDGSLSMIAQSGQSATGQTGGTDMSTTGAAADDNHTNVVRGILGGGALGAGLAIAALAIPGVGPLVAAGAIAATAVPGAAALGAAVGAAAGTVNESLKDHGVSDEDVSYYGDRLKAGGVFLSVDASTGGVDGAKLLEIMARNGGHNATMKRMG